MQPPAASKYDQGGFIYARKKKTAAAAPAVEAPAAEAKESKTRKSAKAPARRGRSPRFLHRELYVEFSGKQYNVTDITDRAKADYRATPQGWRAVLQGIRQARGRRCLLRDQQSSGKLSCNFSCILLLLQSTPHLFCGRLSVPTQGSILTGKLPSKMQGSFSFYIKPSFPERIMLDHGVRVRDLEHIALGSVDHGLAAGAHARQQLCIIVQVHMAVHLNHCGSYSSIRSLKHAKPL